MSHFATLKHTLFYLFTVRIARLLAPRLRANGYDICKWTTKLTHISVINKGGELSLNRRYITVEVFQFLNLHEPEK